MPPYQSTATYPKISKVEKKKGKIKKILPKNTIAEHKLNKTPTAAKKSHISFAPKQEIKLKLNHTNIKKSKTMNLERFLNKHKVVDKTKQKSTHTRITGGNYCILENKLEEFYRLYAEKVFIKKKTDSLTETQLRNQNAPILIDLDFRYAPDVKCRQHDSSVIHDIVELYAETIFELFEVDGQETNVYVFEKPNINRNLVEQKKIVKDGIHLVIQLCVNHTAQQLLRNKILELINAQILSISLDLKNNVQDVLDEGITKGTTNWQLFGSCKPKHEAYQLTQHYHIQFKKTIHDIVQKEVSISDTMFNDVDSAVKFLIDTSAKTNTHFAPELRSEYNNEYANIKNKVKSRATTFSSKPMIENTVKLENDDKYYESIFKIMNRISIEKIKGVQSAAGIILQCAATGDAKILQILHSIMKKADNYDEEWVESKWDSYDKERHENYRFCYAPNCYPKDASEICSHSKIVQFFIQYYGSDFMYSIKSKEFYFWDKKAKLWKGEDLLEPTIHKYLEEDILEELLRHGKESENIKVEEKCIYRKTVLDKLGNQTFRDSVCKNFKNSGKLKLSRNITMDYHEYAKDFFHFKNGCVDLKTGEFRERKRDDYVSKCLSYNYKPRSDVAHHIPLLEKALKQFQPEEKQYGLMQCWYGYCMTGHTKERKWLMQIGYDGNNGKSARYKIHQKCFPIYATSFAKETFSKGNKQRDRELSKLLDGAFRVAFVEELDLNQLDASLLKLFADDNANLPTRRLYKEGQLVPIHAKLTVIGNNDFNLPDADDSTKNRVITQEYNSKFVDKTKHKENPKKHIYYEDKNFLNMLAEDDIKIAYFHILIDYCKEWYHKGLFIPKKNEDFRNKVFNDYDEFGSIFDDNFELTQNENDRVSKKQVVERINSVKNYGWTTILRKCKQKKIQYECKKQYTVSVFDSITGNTQKKRVKGWFFGIKVKQNTSAISEEEESDSEEYSDCIEDYINNH
jgi:phage/plasmid-associated DNA primase